jgi:hypothetical protein
MYEELTEAEALARTDFFGIELMKVPDRTVQRRVLYT